MGAFFCGAIEEKMLLFVWKGFLCSLQSSGSLVADTDEAN